MRTSTFLCTSALILGSASIVLSQGKKPNILFVVADDQSYPDASAYGSKMVRTPAFDFVAKNGILFQNAYVTSPGCSPSRASMLTGRYTWAIEEAGTHASSFPKKYICFPDILKEAGYSIGFTGKGWAPGDFEISGRSYNPAGLEYNEKKLVAPYTSISEIDYVGNFVEFLSKKNDDHPFYFWFGANEPHRPYENDSWKIANRYLAEAEVPASLPNSDIVKGDLLDYATEIEWYDAQLMKMIQLLKEKGELENTIIVITADNGMSFPHSKANCYDAGIHVPLAIYWGSKITKGRVTNELFSTVNLAPTLLEACGAIHRGEYAFQGKSYLSELMSPKEFKGDKEVFAARERHSLSRSNNWGYPMRAIRTSNYLYVQNFHPDRWPAGDPTKFDKTGKLEDAFMDIDDSPSKKFIINNREDKAIRNYFLASTMKRSEAELYDIAKDPSCMNNLANDPAYKKTVADLKKRLFTKLKKTSDSRISKNPEIWESYPKLKGPVYKYPETK